MKETGFEEFWQAWPRSPRKSGKALCKAKWVKMLCWTQSDTIIAHVKYMATTIDWKKDSGAFIPMPATYLNQMRWDGAEFEPVKDTPITDRDPVLLKIERDSAKAVKPSAEIQAKLSQLRGLRTH